MPDMRIRRVREAEKAGDGYRVPGPPLAESNEPGVRPPDGR